jgi:two-component system alkaline phosphatase synthesis response regulator PhoP
MKVLLCEDEDVMRTAIEFRLTKQGYKVSYVSNGLDAIHALSQTLPDILVTDLVMPIHNGIEVIKYLRQNIKSDIPVIVISPVEEDELILEALRAGADDFLAKPFKPLELVLRLRSLIMKHDKKN